ncbi:uncharacterized protein N7515_005925 [Penicillium bovifimosum]|uniref:Uncharacterized protein n=1 Tax=Penicillium bovifimosum TaxID=126998 RepID=A0A9W9GU01_9EURO|nr:uncharacterized protein N7515_005925 [Penicillium bovifimosum]KAJ5129886.1 hypothetical protein N7515_005925 [Penicillium bovifimosum]
MWGLPVPLVPGSCLVPETTPTDRVSTHAAPGSRGLSIISASGSVVNDFHLSQRQRRQRTISSSLTEADNPSLSPALLRSMSSFEGMYPEFFAMRTADWARQIAEQAEENAQDAADFERTDQTQDRESSNQVLRHGT